MRANLWLRTASRVLVRVASFRATKFHELERAAKRIEWKRFLRADAVPDFRVSARKSKLYHSDAIAQRLAEAAGGSVRGKHEQLFVVRVVRNAFEISADSSGELLHMRGYRQATAKAPLRETLAAALLVGADWSGQMALLDPFCGSGTIPIEGALIARKIAPGSNRPFAFMRWPHYDDTIWKTLHDEAHAGIRPGAGVLIRGSDRDGGAIEASTTNAERAGVAADVVWSKRTVSEMERIAESGLVATNPPYGKRVRGGSDVRNIYAQLGNVARRTLGGWRVAIYTSEARLANQTKLPLKQGFQTVNGGIRIGAWVGEVHED
jgi:putative N6-adenine-specific DNA methylase